MMKFSRRGVFGVLGGAAATPVIANDVFAQTLEQFGVKTPTKEEYAEFDKARTGFMWDRDSPFPIRRMEHESELYFSMETSYDDKKIMEGPFPKMSFTIHKHVVDRRAGENALPLIDHLRKAPVFGTFTNDKNLKFRMHSMMNDVARASRRGRGNVLLYSLKAPEFDYSEGRLRLARVQELAPNEFVITYVGATPYDSPFYGFKNVPGKMKQETIFIPHTKYISYLSRFIVV